MKGLPEDKFTADEKRILADHFTNIDGPVFGLINLPEVVKGALFARYSRSPKSLRRLFLDEFVRKSSLKGNQQSAVGLARGEELYDRVLSDYGDDSVAQLGGVHIACEGVSNVLTKLLEWGRLMAYLEQSTRYVPYTDRPNSRWRYHLPDELDRPSLRQCYESTLNSAFETYSALLDLVQTLFLRKFPRRHGDPERAYKASIRSKALDTVRGLLPAATNVEHGYFRFSSSV